MFARSMLAVALMVAAGATVAQAAEWKAKILYRFVTDDAGSDNGYNPRLGVVLDGGDMIGSTNLGGANAGGVIYRRKASGTVKPLYSFVNGDTTGCGYNPSAVLIRGGIGAIYGTTFFGGEGGGGVVFSLTEKSDPTKPWKCTVLKAFYSRNVANKGTRQDGYSPFGGLFFNPNDGKLYGTAQAGGAHGGGVIFRLRQGGQDKQFEVLYNFSKGGNGGYGPAGPLAMDSTGALFGATFFGGSGDAGVIYRLNPRGTGFHYAVIYAFSKTTSGAKRGYQPTQGPIGIDSDDSLYGETTLGGCPDDGTCANPAVTPAGVLFKLNRRNNGTYGYQVLHTFDSDESSTEGYGPYGGLLVKRRNLVYGVAQSGGTRGGGVAFRFNNGTFQVLHNFDPDSEGWLPSSGLIFNGADLVGTNHNGGGDAGTLFQVQAP
jgi:uncharacterized repeat protein (TIGR03803 family)